MTDFDEFYTETCVNCKTEFYTWRHPQQHYPEYCDTCDRAAFAAFCDEQAMAHYHPSIWQRIKRIIKGA